MTYFLLLATVVALCCRFLYVFGVIARTRLHLGGRLLAERGRVILVLGGAAERERVGALIACSEPYHAARLIVSSGCFRRPEDFDPHAQMAHSPQMFQGVDFAALAPRLTIDRRAVDTVTNFTSLASDLSHSGCNRVTLVTSDYHMPRACAIAQIVLHYYGILFDVHPVHGTETHIAPGATQLDELSAAQRRTLAASESAARRLRDIARAWAWVLLGVSGEGASRWVHPERD
jgi:hypothetical protein|uniref:DUF218 domain-containing protein n=1 Tax=Haptolina ericina TaxID=156174 RepID=A0A7S3AN82_9EUKA|mmetsp:Transcript_24018/g.54611  ORF Transcript_24018/g.54611 Transcript_24018/m.54611 type:complete len:232 (+) Transcript_24018:36-731(+)